jgi:aspartate/methionine/tyrosine aminotransferase
MSIGSIFKGKIYTREELEKVAELCIKYNTLCLADEVYEHITYEQKHFRIGKHLY